MATGLQVTLDGDRYVARSPYAVFKAYRDEGLEYPPKAARWRWDPAAKVWWTDDVVKAAKLAPFAVGPAAEILHRIAAEAQAQLDASLATDADLDIPKPAGLDYLPFQRAGIAYALQRTHTLFGDDMGLGKTIQALGVVNATKARRILVVCPASVKLNWEREAAKWLVEPLTIGIANGSTVPDTDVVILNWDILDRNLETLQARTWDVLVADEVHYAKNPKAKRAKALYALRAARTLYLTGTPILNRPVELHPLIKALDPERWGNFMRYAMCYCNAQRTGFGWDFTGASNLEELQEELRRTIMVRRRKVDVLTELPAKRRAVVELTVEGRAAQAAVEAEWETYRAHEDTLEDLRAQARAAQAAGDEEAYKEVIRLLSRETLAAFEEMSRARHETALAKLPQVIAALRDLLDGGDKVVVFCHHRDVHHALMEACGSQAVGIIGGDSPEARQAAIDSFQTDPEVRVFVGSIRAAAEGITLTASSTVLFAELDWTPGKMAQAEDRAHRIGQDSAVVVYLAVLEGSLDCHLARTLLAKEETIQRALDAPQGQTFVTAQVLDTSAAERRAEAAQRREADRKAKERAADLEEIGLTEAQIQLVGRALLALSGVCDGAQTRDGEGFNGTDSGFGKSLAASFATYGTLTPKQAVYGARIVYKYRRTQLSGVFTPEELEALKEAGDVVGATGR